MRAVLLSPFTVRMSFLFGADLDIFLGREIDEARLSDFRVSAAVIDWQGSLGQPVLTFSCASPLSTFPADSLLLLRSARAVDVVIITLDWQNHPD